MLQHCSESRCHLALQPALSISDEGAKVDSAQNNGAENQVAGRPLAKVARWNPLRIVLGDV
jgi:hypothetical protein